MINEFLRSSTQQTRWCKRSLSHTHTCWKTLSSSLSKSSTSPPLSLPTPPSPVFPSPCLSWVSEGFLSRKHFEAFAGWQRRSETEANRRTRWRRQKQQIAFSTCRGRFQTSAAAESEWEANVICAPDFSAILSWGQVGTSVSVSPPMFAFYLNPPSVCHAAPHDVCVPVESCALLRLSRLPPLAITQRSSSYDFAPPWILGHTLHRTFNLEVKSVSASVNVVIWRRAVSSHATEMHSVSLFGCGGTSTVCLGEGVCHTASLHRLKDDANSLKL